MQKKDVVMPVMGAIAFLYFSYAIFFVFPLLPQEAVLMNVLILAGEAICAVLGIYLYHAIACSAGCKPYHFNGIKKYPFVTIQVPVFNEPLEIVRQTLDGCLKMDYPKERYEIIVADDSSDKGAAKKLSRFCSAKGIIYMHRNCRSGYKAGALNNILERSRGEVIAVIDADDAPKPTFLRHSIELMDDVACVQSRSAERNSNESAVTNAGRMFTDFFFLLVMKAKQSSELQMFRGSCAVIRKSVIMQMGGWPEQTLTEDVDMSTKILSAGFRIRYNPEVECCGTNTTSLTGLDDQLSRWAHGTTSCLILRLPVILRIKGIWRKTEHLVSCMAFLVSLVLLSLSMILVYHLLSRLPLYHAYEPRVFWIFWLAILLSPFIASAYVQRESRRLSSGRILSFLFMSYGLCFSISKSCLRAVAMRRKTFSRTPKASGSRSLCAARRYVVEIALGIILVSAGISSLGSSGFVLQALAAVLIGTAFLYIPFLAIMNG